MSLGEVSERANVPVEILCVACSICSVQRHCCHTCQMYHSLGYSEWNPAAQKYWQDHGKVGLAPIVLGLKALAYNSCHAFPSWSDHPYIAPFESQHRHQHLDCCFKLLANFVRFTMPVELPHSPFRHIGCIRTKNLSVFAGRSCGSLSTHLF